MHRSCNNMSAQSVSFLQELHEKKQLYQRLEKLLDLVSNGSTDQDNDCCSLSCGDLSFDFAQNCKINSSTKATTSFSPLPHVRLLDDSPSTTLLKTCSPLVERHDSCTSCKSSKHDISSVLQQEVMYHRQLLKELQKRKIELEHTLALQRFQLEEEHHQSLFHADDGSDADTPGSTVSVALHADGEAPNSDLFEALRDTIYTEAAVLISKNESRPHFLIELFKELQKLTNDYLRQHCLYQIQDVIQKYITDTHLTEGLACLEPGDASAETIFSWQKSFNDQWPKTQLYRHLPSQDSQSCESSLTDSLDYSDYGFSHGSKLFENKPSDHAASSTAPELPCFSLNEREVAVSNTSATVFADEELNGSKAPSVVVCDEIKPVTSHSNRSNEESEKLEDQARDENDHLAFVAEKSVVVDLSVSETKPLTSYGSGEDEEEGSGDEYEFNEPDIATSMQQDALSLLKKDATH